MKFILFLLIFLVGCTAQFSEKIDTSQNQTAVFAGGCFWCMESPFENLEGVQDVVVGYTGGVVENPTYKQVSAGTTSHTEAVIIYYNDSISYEELLHVFWRQFDPTDAGGSFVDRGQQYRSGIFYTTEEQKQIAKQSKNEIQQFFTEPIVTEITEFDTFYKAEEYHQDYHRKNPIRYNFYRSNSGRDQFLEKQWG